MSKGKRKSVPGVYPIIQQKLRSGTLSADDRNTLHQLARLDLIELVENELGMQLKASQKNSVAAMIDFLLGPEGGEASGRRRPRRSPAMLLKRSRRGSGLGGQQVARTSTAAHQREQLKVHHHYQSAGAAIKQEGCNQAAGDFAQQQYTAATAAQDDYETEGSCLAGLDPCGFSGEVPQQQQQYEQDQWLRELQMQLTAADTVGDDADDNAALVDDGTSTPQSAMAPQQLWLGPHATAGRGHAAGSEEQQHDWCATLNQGHLETKLLDQLLGCMQLSPQAHHHHHHQQQQQQHQQQQALPQHLPGQQTSQMVQIQPQHQIQHLHSQQHMQLHLQPSLQVPLQQHYGRSSSAAAAAAMMYSSGYHSCPLPVAVTTSIPGSCSSTLPALAVAAVAVDSGGYTAYPFSTGALLQGQDQQQQSFDWLEATPSGSLIKKCDRRQMTWHTAAAAAAAAHGPVAAPLSVELSGPSADVATKRMSLVAPGTGSVSAVATSPAGVAGAVDIQQQIAEACSHQYMDTTDDSGDNDHMLLRQLPQLRQHNSLKKGMKGLARRVKAFLQSGNSKHQPQEHQLDGHMPAGSASTDPAAAGLYSSATDPEGFAVWHGAMTDKPTIRAQCPLAHQFSAASLPDFRLHSGATDVGSFAANRTASAPSAYQTTMQQTYDSTPATAHLAHLGSSSGYSGGGAGSQQSFAERLQLLRAMYDPQDMTQHPESLTAAAAAAGGGPQTAVVAAAAAGAGAGGVGSLPIGHVMQQQQQQLLLFGGMPALQEESGVVTPAAAPSVLGGPKPSSPSPFLHKITKALGINTKHTDKQEEATAALAASSGLSLTERSNSSFSRFLATVANSWTQESSSTAAATIPISTDTWPSAATATGTVLTASTRLGSCSSHNRSFPQDRPLVQGFLPSTEGAGTTGAAAAVAAVAAAGIEQSRGSFSELFGQHGRLQPAAARISLEPSRGSVDRAFGLCACGAPAHTPAEAAAVAAGAGHIGVEPSHGSFGNVLGMCARRDTENSVAGVTAAPGIAVESSNDSFSHLLAMCPRSDTAATAAAFAAEAGSSEAGPISGVALLSDVGSGELVPGALATACGMGLLQFDDVVMGDGVDE